MACGSSGDGVKPVADTLVAKINLALEPFGETLRTSRGREIGERGRYYTVDHIGRVVQADVCLTGLAVELGVMSRRATDAQLAAGEGERT